MRDIAKDLYETFRKACGREGVELEEEWEELDHATEAGWLDVAQKVVKHLASPAPSRGKKPQ